MFDHIFVPGWDGPSVPLSAHKRTLRLLAAVLLLLSAVCFCLRGIRGRGDLTLEMEERQIPLFYQTDPRWGGNAYGDSTIAVSGCGPTCLSMVICGLTQTQDWGPASVAAFAEAQGYYIPGIGTAWDLMTAGAADLGLMSKSLPCTADVLLEASPDAPLICSMMPGDFTKGGHFIVIVGVDESGRLIVNDPASEVNSKKRWDAGRVADQVKGVWQFALPADAAE